jgi:UDP-2,3-diacylglucosamine pyrophosphatase LpxH
VQKLLRKARKGSEVIYVPGNHDESARQFFGLSFGDVRVVEEVIHTTVDGRKLWVTHGDQFDGVMQYAKWLAYVGDNLYSFILYINRYFNMLRARMGLQYWSLSQYLKHQVKNAVSYIADFEHIMAREARLRGCDGVVCGHIHKAEIREIDGLLYCNDGDWVESLSALVETHTGELKIIYWTHIKGEPVETPQITLQPAIESLIKEAVL